MVYTVPVEVFKSETFDAWFSSLRDRRAKVRIAARIDRVSLGNFGDVKPVGSGVSELRIDYGPGYRVYFTRRGLAIVLILCAGDKRTQSEDIELAIDIAASWRDTSDGDKKKAAV